MPGAIYPYTVTNSYKGGLFMRTYSRNVRRAWDGEDYRPPKRQRLDTTLSAPAAALFCGYGENLTRPFDLEDNLERAIRETSVAAMSSSPSRKNSTIFSAESHDDDDAGSNTVTPPSSPPPTLQITPPNVKARKPTFSFLDKGKKEKKEKNAKQKADALYGGITIERETRQDSEPLSEILNYSNRASTQPPIPANASTSQQQRAQITTPRPTPQFPKLGLGPQNLVQTRLDLGQPLLPITCPQCQMSYTPSVPEDVQLHDMYHSRDSSGVELGKAFLKSAMKWCYQVPNIPGSVVVVDRKITLPGRRAVQKILEIVNAELGSVEIKEEDLWTQRDPDGEIKDEPALNKKCDRYKVFLHIVDEKCVGVCLAERISKAHRVLPYHTANSETIRLNGHSRTTPPVTAADEADDAKDFEATLTQRRPEIPTPVASPTSSPSSSISISEETVPAVVGVSRIWTSRAFRHKGIASNLLDCVVNQFIYGMEIDRSEVAFSQPTESGAALARSWFGEDDGWSVYRED